MAKRKLRLVFHVPMWGFSSGYPMSVYFTDEKTFDKPHGLYALTRGEGSAFQFVLEDTDLAQGFHEALQSGRFLKDMQDRDYGQMYMVFVPKGKRIKIVDDNKRKTNNVAEGGAVVAEERE